MIRGFMVLRQARPVFWRIAIHGVELVRAAVFVSLVLAAAIGAPAPASACEYVRGPIIKLLEEWSQTCGHPLCGTVYVAEPGLMKEAAKACDRPGWMSMREDVRATVVAGGAVLFGEVHDNPLHHELRSRLGLSAYASSVLEQVSADKAAGLDAFQAETKLNYQTGALEKFKTAVDWQNSGWQTYNYDPLLTAALKAQKPIFAGDAARETIKKIAKEGESAVPADERARLKLDVPLGEKADAAMLDELFESHCSAMPRETLSPMAVAQRYRDAVLADTALAAITKHGSTIVLAGNGHVRKDRGVPWYIHQRDPAKKTLSVLLVEVEDGKTDAEAYVPKDAEGKPAADYIIFTPRAPHEDHCAELKKKG